MTKALFSTDTIWFEIAVVTLIILLGHIYLGHFEERSPKGRKLLKYLITVVIITTLSIYFGRTLAFVVLGLALLPVLYIHFVLLPKKGINGWTGEPKARYYDFRGWDKNIFEDKSGSADE
jgi:hypothetical protein